MHPHPPPKAYQTATALPTIRVLFSPFYYPDCSLGQAKWRNKRHRGTHRHHLESYMTEFLWRQSVKEGEDVFEDLLEAIHSSWPCDDDL